MTDIETDSQPKFPVKFKYVMPTAPPSGSQTGSDPPPPPAAATTTAAAPPAAASAEVGAMTARVENYSLQFKMSGLMCLSDFIEDEKLPQVVPMSITVKNVLLVLDVSDCGLVVRVWLWYTTIITVCPAALVELGDGGMAVMRAVAG